MMTRVTRRVTWAMGHRLMRHGGKCFFPHGHTYVAEVTIEGPINDTQRDPEYGMVMDFGHLDAILDAIIGDWDHAFMVEHNDPFAHHLASHDYVQGRGRTVVVPWTPTAENIAREIWDRVTAALLQEGIRRRCRMVRVEEGPKSWAEYGGEHV